VHGDLAERLAERGARLHEVRKELLRQEPGTTQRWFQGHYCDLFLWYDGERGLSQVQLTFEGRVVEWAAGEQLRTGRLVAFDPRTPLVDRGRIVFDPAPDAQTLALSRALLSRAGVDELTLSLVRRKLSAGE
jgi:predicted nucleic acid-binding Zn ribbon protein